jgi:signal transduction histidine kinase
VPTWRAPEISAISAGGRFSSAPVPDPPANPLDGRRRLGHDPRVRIRMAAIGVFAVGVLATVLGLLLLLFDGRSSAGDYIFSAAFFVAGACAINMAPRHVASFRLLLVGTLLLGSWTAGSLLSVAYVRTGVGNWMWVANLIQQLMEYAGLATLVALFAVLPDGRYRGTYERWVVRLVLLLAIAAPPVALVTMPVVPTGEFVWARPVIASPFYLPSLATLAPSVAGLINARLFTFAIAVLLLAVRYRWLSTMERLQVRWVLLTGSLLPTVIALASLSGLSFPRPFVDWMFVLSIGAIPFGILLSIVQYRLLDVDRVARRLLVYALLWGAIGLAYVGMAALVGILTGQHLPLWGAVLLTVLAAVTFQPVRSRLERLINRLLFGQPADGYETIRSLGTALERAGDMEEVGTTLAVTVRRGLGARWVRVRLFSEGDPTLGCTIGSDGMDEPEAAEAELAVPIPHRGEVIGAIECGPRVTRNYGLEDRQLLATIGRQAAWAIRSANLNSELSQRLEQLESQTQDLAESRARLVNAADQERRRIERNIHDGAQQQLVALMAKLGRARDQTNRRPNSAGAILDELQDDTARLLDDLRELAQGIHPAVLSDAGLLEAINAQADRLPITVTVTSEPGFHFARFPDHIEGAAYFIVCEGLANAVKHSGANSVRIRLGWRDQALSIDVADDGHGFDGGLSTGTGLRGLRDRAAALGGTFQVDSRAGLGTRLLASLPAAKPAVVL